MDASDELRTIAELAIGLAGFSGVVAAFSYRGRLGDVDRYHFLILFTVSFAAVFLCFVPFGVHKVVQDVQAVWQSSSAIMLAASVLVGVFLTAATPMSMRWDSSMEFGLLGGALISFILPVLIILSQLANVIGWPAGPDSLLYVGGLLGWLLVAGLNFLRLVLYGASTE